LKSAAEFLVDKATRFAGVAGRKVFGMPLHFAVPIALLVGVAAVVVATSKAREAALPASGNPES
jgi:hypothetical protein